MFVSVTNKDIRRQLMKTSCWISTAQYVLQFIGVQIPLEALHAQYYSPDADSASLMSGAGKPKTILQAYAPAAGWMPATLDFHSSSKTDAIAVIAESIRSDIPVIAGIRSEQIAGFFHAVLITTVDPDTGTIGFKDPATGTTPRPFGVDVRTVQYDEFKTGFSYGYANEMKVNVFAYCTKLTYLQRVAQSV